MSSTCPAPAVELLLLLKVVDSAYVKESKVVEPNVEEHTLQTKCCKSEQPSAKLL